MAKIEVGDLIVSLPETLTYQSSEQGLVGFAAGPDEDLERPEWLLQASSWSVDSTDEEELAEASAALRERLEGAIRHGLENPDLSTDTELCEEPVAWGALLHVSALAPAHARRVSFYGLHTRRSTLLVTLEGPLEGPLWEEMLDLLRRADLKG